MKKKSKRIKIVAKGEKKAEVLIYEDIGEGWLGGLSAKMFAEDLKGLGDLEEINVRINSSGGSVFDGVAIYNTLRKHKARVRVEIDGLAASIASLIAMAGDEINMAANAMMMIHDPWAVVAGTSAELREQAEMMDKVREVMIDTYVSRSTADEEKIGAMMAAETWLTAAEALQAGLVHSVTEELKMAAHFDLSRYKNVPPTLKAEIKQKTPAEGVAINGEEADTEGDVQGAITRPESPDKPGTAFLKGFHTLESVTSYFTGEDA